MKWGIRVIADTTLYMVQPVATLRGYESWVSLSHFGQSYDGRDRIFDDLNEAYHYHVQYSAYNTEFYREKTGHYYQYLVEEYTQEKLT